MKTEVKNGTNTAGTVMTLAGRFLMTLILLLCLLTYVPRILGGGAYDVSSGSMEPTFSVGTLIVAIPVDPEKLVAGDIISFYEGDTVLTHRVVSNDHGSMEVITKGDANNMEDFAPIPYSAVIGKAYIRIPMLGRILGVMLSSSGKLVTLIWLALGALLSMLGHRLKDNE